MSADENRKKTLLIIEDDKIFQSIYRSLLDVGWITLLSAYDGQDGLTMARDNKPDLIVLDINIPTIDGISLLRTLRSDPDLKNTKVLIATNYDSEDYRKQTAELGVVGYVLKVRTTPIVLVKQMMDILNSPSEHTPQEQGQSSSPT